MVYGVAGLEVNRRQVDPPGMSPFVMEVCVTSPAVPPVPGLFHQDSTLPFRFRCRDVTAKRNKPVFFSCVARYDDDVGVSY